ncbi:transposase [Actinomyces bowdenii]|uniref:transposase n=1 Tax=Actinomyces bowdenii TaxID=131109 RepID=UPI0035A33530
MITWAMRRASPRAWLGVMPAGGTTSKTIDSEVGSFEIEVPRDRAGSFTPRLVRKGQRPMDGLDACESSACTPVG